MSAVIERRDIPDTWQLMPLKELGDWSGGGTPSKAKPEFWTNGKIPWVSPKDMKTECITDSEDHITNAAVEASTAKLIPAGSVLVVTRSGILSHTLPVAVTAVPVTVNQDLKAVTPKVGVLPEYIAWALRCFAREILNTCSKQGTTVASIETAALHRFEIPIAPLDQQKRIVAEIEKQFSRLDEAVANLKRVKANLKRYKAAVLKAAVEGRLVETEADLARKRTPSPLAGEGGGEGAGYETGEQLLQRILETRRSQWKGKGKYKQPAAPDTTDLPELPEGWAWAKFDQVTERITKGSSPNWQGFEYSERGIPFVRSQNVGWGVTDLSDIAFLPPGFNAVEKKSVLREGDVLLNIVGASIGRAAIAPSTVEGGNVNQAVAVIRLLESGVINEFVLLYLLSAQTQRRIHAEKVDVARANFSLEDIREMPLSLPPRGEQDRIVAEVDRRLTILRETEAQVDANLQRAEHLRQSILGHAFSGSISSQYHPVPNCP
ncbi:MAG: restriction endonuclease subunit S [Pseudomonadota bacterium]